MIVEVHPRVLEGHPELSDLDVEHAVRNTIKSLEREDTDPAQTVGVGPDLSGNILQWIGNRIVDNPIDSDYWFIFHSMPVTKKVLYELEMI